MLTQTTAENLQVGDRSSHLGQFWQVASTPRRTRQGIQFNVIVLTTNSQQAEGLPNSIAFLRRAVV